MGGCFPPLDRAQVEAILRNAGFSKIRQTGSHSRWAGFVGNKQQMVTVKNAKGGKKIKYGPALLNSMINQSGLSKQEFYAYLQKKPDA